MPEPRAQGPRRGVGRQASSQARQVAQDLARMDVALGPAEVALGNIIGILAGAAVGVIPAIVFRSGGLLPVGVLLGAIVGWLVSRLIRNRLTIRGWRLGGCGVLVVGILTICFACSLIGAISGSQNRRAAVEIFRRQKEMGITIPKAAEELLSQPSSPSLWEKLVVPFTGVYALVQGNTLLHVAVVTLGAMMVVISVVALVGLLIYGFRRRRSW